MIHKIKQFTTHHLVKSEDLNHHGTLFAGRGAEWFVESGFVAAATLIHPKNLICVKLDSLNFQHPVKLGEIVCYNSRIIKVGRTSLVAYIKASKNDCSQTIVDGFAVYVHVDENTKAIPHDIVIESSCVDDDKIIRYHNYLNEFNKKSIDTYESK
jgi:acyl-CoA hydrolase